MVETLHPDVFVLERRGTPRILGVSVTTPAFVLFTKKGSVDRLNFVTGYGDFVRQMGEFYKGSFAPHAMKAYFDTAGGGRAYVIRILGDNHTTSELNFVNMAPVGTPAQFIGTEDIEAPTHVDLTNKHFLRLDVDNVGPIEIDLNSVGASPANARTLQDIIDSINAAIAGIASADDDNLVLTSTTLGTASELEILPAVSGAFAATLVGTGFNAAALNAGNHSIGLELDDQSPIVIDVTGDAGVGGGYTIASVIIEINNAANGAWGAAYNAIAADVAGQIVITSPTTGVASEIELVDVPGGIDARLEVFGIPEGTDIVTNIGGTGDAIALVLGLAEGPTYTFNGTANLPEVMKIKARTPGEHGNSLSVSFARWTTTLLDPILSGADEAHVGSIRGIEIGDIVELSDGVTTIVRLINEIDRTNQLIKWIGQGVPHTQINTLNSTVKSSSTHRKTTTLVTAITATDSIATLANTNNIRVGTRLAFDDKGTNPIATALVTAVNGNEITFAPLGQNIDVDAIVSTMHFSLKIKDEGEVVETYEYLSMEPTDVRDFFQVRLGGSGNESSFIEVEEILAAITNQLFSIPKPVENIFLAGGVDGNPPSDLDWIGTDVEPKKGIFLLDDVDDVSIIDIPGVTFPTTLRRLASYCENRGFIVGVGNTPLEDDEALEAREFRQNELAIDNSYMALYYPWAKIRDPEADSEQSLIDVPLTPFAVGAMIRVAREQNVSVAPANFRLTTVDSLTHFTTDGEQDILNPIGVNVVRFFPGSGILIWGARTLSNFFDGRHYLNVRRLLNFVKISARKGNRFAVFQPNDPQLWSQITTVNTDFLRGLWQQGMLFPSNDVTRAFFVLCNEETNPPEERKAGRVNIEIGINPPLPAEFVIIRVGLFDEGETVEEVIRRV